LIASCDGQSSLSPSSAKADILAEVDVVALYHYKLKVAYENKVRRRFGRVQGQHDADAEDEATQALVQGVVGEISFGELVTGDAADLAAEETDDESDESSTEYETDSDETGESNEMLSSPVVPRMQDAPQSARPARSYTYQEGATETSPRSSSLRSSKSMTFSLSRSSSRYSQGTPPVPPLPKGLPLSPLSKPLPPSPRQIKPRQHSSTDDLPSPAYRHTATPLKSHHGKGKKTDALKPPELHHIPELLPVFIEMMRHLLRPRQS